MTRILCLSRTPDVLRWPACDILNAQGIVLNNTLLFFASKASTESNISPMISLSNKVELLLFACFPNAIRLSSPTYHARV
jgi:hypothetical protein